MATDLSSIEAELRRHATALGEIFHELEKHKPREPRQVWVNYYEGDSHPSWVSNSYAEACEHARGTRNMEIVAFVEVIR